MKTENIEYFNDFTKKRLKELNKQLTGKEMGIKDKYYYISELTKIRDKQENELYKIALFGLIMEFIYLDEELTEEKIKELNKYLNKLETLLK